MTSNLIVIQPTDLATTSTDPVTSYLASVGASSRRPIEQSLRLIGELVTGEETTALPWHELRPQHVTAIRQRLAEECTSHNTANRHLSALRGVLKECWRLELMGIEEYHRAIDFKPVKGSGPDQAAGRALAVGELGALLEACARDSTAAGDRDAAIIAVMYCGGLRRAEVASLTVEAFDEGKCTLIVTGKGNKTRNVPVLAACDAISDWLNMRGWHDGPMFNRIRKGGEILPNGVTAQSVYDILSKRATQANVKAFTPHDLRRTFAGDMMDQGVDVVTVQKLMGHANTKTTSGYDRRGERAKMAAAETLHIPWERRR